MIFDRFTRNVVRYPRTFVVLLVLAVIDVALSTLPNQGRTVLIGVGVDLFLAAIGYILFMRDSRRVFLLLQMLDTFEGRQPCSLGDEVTGITEGDEITGVDDEEGCGNPDCNDCNPKVDLINDEQGQDVAEYAVMMAVMLVLVIGVLHLIGSNAGNVFSNIGSKIGGQ